MHAEGNLTRGGSRWNERRKPNGPAPSSRPSFAFPASSTIRAALAGFTKLYSDRHARAGIRMNDVLPGYLENWEWTDSLKDSIPAGRPGALTEIARVVAFLLSDEAGYITGQGVRVDGGLARSA